jgi:hypothetical protein
MDTLFGDSRRSCFHRELSAFVFLGFSALRFIVAVTTALNFVFLLVSTLAARGSVEAPGPVRSCEPAERSDLLATNKPFRFCLYSNDPPEAECGPRCIRRDRPLTWTEPTMNGGQTNTVINFPLRAIRYLFPWLKRLAAIVGATPQLYQIGGII